MRAQNIRHGFLEYSFVEKYPVSGIIYGAHKPGGQRNFLTAAGADQGRWPRGDG